MSRHGEVERGWDIATRPDAASGWRRGGGEGERRAGRSGLLRFYLYAFGISWCGYLPLIAGSHGVAFFQSRLWLAALILPGVGPAVAAAIVSSSSQSRNAELRTGLVRMRQAFLRPVPARWWFLVVLLAVGIMLVAGILTQATKDPHGSLLRPVSAGGLMTYILLSLMANPLEEIGWRGFAQTRFEERYRPLTSACIVGVLWALWHVPLFLLSGQPMGMAEMSFPAWAAGVVPQAILLAWIYRRTGRSLATVSVFHLLGNVAGSLFDASEGMVSGVRLGLAVLVVGLSGSRLGPGQPVEREPFASDRI